MKNYDKTHSIPFDGMMKKHMMKADQMRMDSMSRNKNRGKKSIKDRGVKLS